MLCEKPIKYLVNNFLVFDIKFRTDWRGVGWFVCVVVCLSVCLLVCWVCVCVISSCLFVCLLVCLS